MEFELTTAEANRRFFRAIAEEYDRTEHCLVDPRQQESLKSALQAALERVPGNPRVLDACGGSGNVGLMLLDLGIEPVVVDISPEMVAIWKSKAHSLGYDPEVHISEISEFLGEDERTWDMITFSAALHHLGEYERVLSEAASSLAPGGIIFTMFDPTKVGWLGERLRKIDWIAAVMIQEPRRFLRLLVARLSRAMRPHDQDLYLGRMAERYAIEGIDDLVLRRRLEERGLEVCVHRRYYDARLSVIRWLFRLIRRPPAFHLVVKRGSQEALQLGGDDGRKATLILERDGAEIRRARRTRIKRSEKSADAKAIPRVSDHYRGAKGESYFWYQESLAETQARITRRRFAPYVRPGDVVVDFGCGSGRLLAALPAQQKIGVEVNPRNRMLASNLGIQVVEMAEEIPRASVDVVISNHALEHTLSPFAEIRSLYSLLKPGGKFVLAVPADDWRVQKRPDVLDINHHLYTWTPLLLGHLLREVGFEVLNCHIVRRALPGRLTPGLVRSMPWPAFEAVMFLTTFIVKRRDIFAVARKPMFEARTGRCASPRARGSRAGGTRLPRA
jgi:SAM-dependent methyltransferase